jgi:hypothetical protein
MKKRLRHRPSAYVLIASLVALAALSRARAAAETSTAPTRIDPYFMASHPQEIALARSAAPASISMHATVMVLGIHGYFTAVSGNNGFVCLVARSWDNTVRAKDANFWNPKFRAPLCFNRAAAQSVLPRYLTRTKWVLAGASRSEIGDREEAARAAGQIEKPASGAVCYMMSKLGWGIGNQPGPWRPHLMFYFPRSQKPVWGANLPGTPVIATADDGVSTSYVLVPIWSDGSPAPKL